jgi:hypothetical protein
MLSSNIPPKGGKVLCRSPDRPNINTSSVKRAYSNVFANFPPSSNNPRTSRPTTTDHPARSPATENELDLPPQPSSSPLKTVTVPQQVRVWPGKLDSIPVFNSNSPEVVQTEGILLSTFGPEAKQVASAHLNFPFKGRFGLFAHHIAKAKNREETRTLFQGIIVHNPNS